METTNQEKEYLILHTIYASQDQLKQRELARNTGLSLGMTNAIIKRLLLKGLLVVQRINQRTIRYMLTPSGVKLVLKRSYNYLKKTLKQVSIYHQAIAKLIHSLKTRKFNTIFFYGKSELFFLIEYCCAKEKIKLIKLKGPKLNLDPKPPNFLLLLSEEIRSVEVPSGIPHLFLFDYLKETVSLNDLLAKL